MAFSSSPMTLVSIVYCCHSCRERRNAMVSPATTGVQPRLRMAFQVPLRAIRSNRPRSISEKYMPLLTCIAMSMSVGRTRSGSDEASQMPSGGRRAEVMSRRRVRRSRCMDTMLPVSNKGAKGVPPASAGRDNGHRGPPPGGPDGPTISGADDFQVLQIRMAQHQRRILVHRHSPVHEALRHGPDRPAQGAGLRGMDVDGERNQSQAVADVEFIKAFGALHRAHLDAPDPVAAHERPLRRDHRPRGEA